MILDASVSEIPFLIPNNLNTGIKINRNNKMNSIVTNNQNKMVLDRGSNQRKYSTISVKNRYSIPKAKKKILPLMISFV